MAVLEATRWNTPPVVIIRPGVWPVRAKVQTGSARPIASQAAAAETKIDLVIASGALSNGAQSKEPRTRLAMVHIITLVMLGATPQIAAHMARKSMHRG
jgi:hypothetical protein